MVDNHTAGALEGAEGGILINFGVFSKSDRIHNLSEYNDSSRQAVLIPL